MWRKSKSYLLIFPATAVLSLLFYGGMARGLFESLDLYPEIGTFRFSLSEYRELAGSADFWNSLTVTLRISLLSTIAASILGLLISVFLFWLGHGRIKKWGQRIFQIPLLVPHLVGAYLMVLLFMQSGWFSRIGFHLGWIDHIEQFPILINERFGWGIIFTYAWKEAPFVGLMLYPVLQRIHGTWMEVARVYGAGNFSFFKEILFPLLMPALISASFIVFAFTFSAFEVPFLLGVTYPKMLPVLSYDLYTSGGLLERPKALAVNVILAVITACLGFASYRLSRHWQKTGGRGW
jgi:putative spermidine/putrescine transport system permease protein